MTTRRMPWRAALPPVISFVTITVAAELLILALKIDRNLLPRPSEVIAAGWRARSEMWQGTITTAAAALTGLALAMLAGMVIAVALSTSRLIERAFYPYAVFFQTVPIIAIAPLLVVWLGAGYRSVAVSAFIVSIFPVIANTLTGLLGTDPALRDLFRLYGAGPVATLLKLKLPSALPNIVTGMRIASGLAVIGAIVGEFVAGQAQGAQGLGMMVLVALNRFRTDLVFATVLAASVLGLAMFALVNLTGHLLLRRWRAPGSRR